MANKQGGQLNEMRDEEGNLTGHLVGLFYKTIMLYECGVRPIWVFDGKAPREKKRELEKRSEYKEKSAKEGKKAQEDGDMKKVKQMAGRSLRVTADMVKDAKKLLELMGCPVIQAPCEAEAQCAELVRQGFAYGVASDDMDCLAHGAQYMIRGFTNKNHPVVEIDYDAVLKTLQMS